MAEDDKKTEKRVKGIHMVLKNSRELRKRHIIDTSDVRKGNVMSRQQRC